MKNRRFMLTRRPSGMPVDDDFALVVEQTPALEEGQFLLRNHYASLDPAMRGWMDDRPSYLPPMRLGDPVRASTIGVVAESRNADFPVGASSVTNYLSVLSGVGLTAYFALFEVGRPKAGETVLVSG